MFPKRNLKNSKFKQQKLAAWRPVPTITSTTIIFVVFGISSSKAFLIFASVAVSTADVESVLCRTRLHEYQRICRRRIFRHKLRQTGIQGSYRRHRGRGRGTETGLHRTGQQPYPLYERHGF